MCLVKSTQKAIMMQWEKSYTGPLMNGYSRKSPKVSSYYSQMHFCNLVNSFSLLTCVAVVIPSTLQIPFPCEEFPLEGFISPPPGKVLPTNYNTSWRFLHLILNMGWRVPLGLLADIKIYKIIWLSLGGVFTEVIFIVISYLHPLCCSRGKQRQVSGQKVTTTQSISAI